MTTKSVHFPHAIFVRTMLVRAMLVTAMSCLINGDISAQMDFDGYTKATPDNCVSTLIEDIEAGDIQLKYDEAHGYLESLLQQLDVSVDSQALVFSKTSRQRRRISPQAPRAVYFNDDVYVGWVKEGDVIEISAADPELGAVFYTLDQRAAVEKPEIMRQLGQCMLCHTSTHTGRIPGHIVRSVFTDKTGDPILGSPTRSTTDQSPMSERWGGWYVTGSHGAERHMGNAWIADGKSFRDFDRDSGANILDLSDHFDVSAWLSPHSDIVALMVMEHQIAMHNQFTTAKIEWESYWKDAREINLDNGVEADHMTDESQARLEMLSRTIVDGLLMKNETELTSPISGTSEFAATFAKKGPADKTGRSLRQFDLQTRLFRYPCSYMIYSKPFDALHEPVKETVFKQLKAALETEETAEEYSMNADQRSAILEILTATKREFANHLARE